MTKNEYQEWYESCEFIKRYMQFYSYNDFYENCKFIKEDYKLLNTLEKQMYKWYFFANVNVSRNQLMIMWDYLNDYITYEELITPQEIERRKNARNNKQTKILNK